MLQRRFDQARPCRSCQRLQCASCCLETDASTAFTTQLASSAMSKMLQALPWAPTRANTDRIQSLSTSLKCEIHSCAPALQLASSVVGEVLRDPGRLLQPTAATKKQVEARRTTGSMPRDSGYIRHVSRRATADWTVAS